MSTRGKMTHSVETKAESEARSITPLFNEGHPITIEVKVRLQAVALPEAGGGFSVLIPALGIATEGDTIEEVQANIVEAAEGFLDTEHDQNKDDGIRMARGGP